MRKLKPLKVKGPSHDPQVKAVYRWERQFRHWNEGIRSVHYCRKLIRAACELYGVAAPVVRGFKPGEHRGVEASLCFYEENRILLRPYHLNDAIALHEAAHAIVYQRFGQARLDHGPTWLGVYMSLLAGHSVMPRESLEASAKQHGLDWVSFEESSPTRVRVEAKAA